MRIDGKARASLHNRFDIVKVNPKTGEEKQIAFAENIILNTLWSTVIGSTAYTEYFFSKIAFGSGTGTLVATRTALFTKIASVSAGNTYGVHNREEGWYSRRKEITLTEAQYAGSTITEVGIEKNDGSLQTHAMLKDMNGNQTSITKTDQDIIKIYATVYVRWSTTGYQSGKIFVPDYETAAIASAFVDWLLGGQQWMYGGSARLISFSGRRENTGMTASCYGLANVTLTRSYNISNKTVSVYGRIPAGGANTIHGIRSVAFGQEGSLAWAVADLLGSSFFTPVEITAEQIGVGDGETVGFKTAFPYVQPGAVVYVDGVEQVSGVTVYENIPANSDLGPEMILIDKNSAAVDFGVNTNSITTAGRWGIFENPKYATHGIYTIKAGYGTLTASDDLENWDTVGELYVKSGTISVAEAYRHKRYWKHICPVSTQSYGWRLYDALSDDFPAGGNNIVFDTAPAAESVITIDYTPGVVPKDANHVFDFTFTLTLAEYVPE